MTEQRKKIIGSYLMEEEAMNKVNWLKGEGYRPEELWIIRDRRGVLEQLGEEPITRSGGINDSGYQPEQPTSSVVSPSSLLTPETKSVAVTLMEQGINKEEAYRYEFDVKVGKMLILADSDPTSDFNHNTGMQEGLTGKGEEPALMIEDDEKIDWRPERDIKIDGRENAGGKADMESGNVTGSSINKPLPDTNIDSSIPLDEQLLTEEPVMDGKTEKDYAREEVISLHDQARLTNESQTLQREEVRADTTSAEPDNGKRYAENKREEDVDKALLYEHGQPFPMEKPYEEDVYDRNVMADGPLHVEDVPGDGTTTERDSPKFQSKDGGLRPKSDYELEEHGDSTDEENDIHSESSSNQETDPSLYEEEHSAPFSSSQKDRMEKKRTSLFDTEDDDLFRK